MWLLLIVLILVDSKLMLSEGLSQGASDMLWICHKTDESSNNVIYLIAKWGKNMTIFNGGFLLLFTGSFLFTKPHDDPLLFFLSTVFPANDV